MLFDLLVYSLPAAASGSLLTWWYMRRQVRPHGWTAWMPAKDWLPRMTEKCDCYEVRVCRDCGRHEVKGKR